MNQEEIMQKIQQLKQQGKSNEEIVQFLVSQGVDYQTAVDLVTQFDLQMNNVQNYYDPMTDQLQATAEVIVSEKIAQIYYLLQQYFQVQQTFFDRFNELFDRVEKIEKKIEELEKEQKEESKKILNQVENINAHLEAFESVFEKISASLMDTTKQLNYILKKLRENY
ncbi:MAG: hypothetical protein ABGW69_00775 [Nanoarchaeota archaeon]